MRRAFCGGAAAALFCLLSVAPVAAQVSPMTDAALAEVTGQAGIAIGVNDLAFDLKAADIYYGDKDGLGPGTGAGYLSLTNVALEGSVAFATPVTVDITTRTGPHGDIQVANLLLRLSDMTLKIDSFSIDAIRLGSAPGRGESLGSFGIDNMTLRLTGSITISAN